MVRHVEEAAVKKKMAEESLGSHQWLHTIPCVIPIQHMGVEPKIGVFTPPNHPF